MVCRGGGRGGPTGIWDGSSATAKGLTLWLVRVFEVMLLVIASAFELRKIFTEK